MFYTEAYKERQALETRLKDRWSRALNANGGIADEHLARATAILCENYLTELKEDPRLIAEDRVQTGAFRGVNLALLGLITRVIPNLVGAELVGVQAMPTPRAPIFTMTWHKDNTKSFTSGSTGTYPNDVKGDEMWVTPISQNAAFGGVDPYYTSNEVYEKKVKTDLDGTAKIDYVAVWAADLASNGYKGYIFPDSLAVYYLDSEVTPEEFATSGDDSNILAKLYHDGTFTGDDPNFAAYDFVNDTDLSLTAASIYDVSAQTFTNVGQNDTPNSGALFDVETATSKTVGSVIFVYQYDAEAEGLIPEISFKIEEESIGLIRRQLRGKYTVDAVQDLKVLHGVNLDSELVNMMKNELMHEINHEIITDIRKMAKHVKTLDFNDFVNYTVGTAGAVTTGNYEDAARVMLDAMNKMAAIIWTQGRMGYANWVVGNPSTLCYLDRVPGFVGSGVNFNGRDISYAGSAGGKMKIYHDPTYPEGELLVGYKGGSALETGYLYCPYLPITATPTLYDPKTGDPSKIFYTRYAKTYKTEGENWIKPKSVILNGELQYGRIKLEHFPGDALLT